MNLWLSISRNLTTSSRRIFSHKNSKMAGENISLISIRKCANFRAINVSGWRTDLLEIISQDPKLHILFIPGNPGVVAFYSYFLESLYELLGGTASISAIGHISHSEKSAEPGRLFSLQEQINHKTSFIEQELQDCEMPMILVGHSIGSHISLELFKRFPEKVMLCFCLYPFLAVNTLSSTQSAIRKLAASRALCLALSASGTLMGMLPAQVLRFIVKNSVGKNWSSSAIGDLCTHLLKYHTIQNVLFMAKTEFEKMPEKPDWDFIRAKKNQISFLFGDDDHWGPLYLYEEICEKVPGAHVVVEREGHTHAFSCSEAGSKWAAQSTVVFQDSYVKKTRHYISYIGKN